MEFVEYPIGVRGDAPQRVGNLRCCRSRALANVVEAIWDCEIPDAEFARTLTIKCAPSTSLWLVGQYRAPAEMRQEMSQGAVLLPAKCATQIRSHTVTLRPTGALGVIIVCLRSDAASRIVKTPLKEFANTTLHLSSLFRASEVATCDDMLAAAHTSEERIAGIQSFLLRHLRPRNDSLANAVALHLRKDPALPIQSLAAKLGFSARHLAREFNAAFGISPKRFARLARFQKILAARRQSQSWAEVAYTCGLTDQSHLIREFQDIVGESPTEFFTHELRVGAAGMDEANLVIQRRGPADFAVTC